MEAFYLNIWNVLHTYVVLGSTLIIDGYNLQMRILRLLRNMSKNFSLDKMLVVILLLSCLMTIEGNSHPLTFMEGH
ncbi:unnamed protein product [Trifolium pratense]|uniref:Uncharacterized protein n=1 Tax=Trifolium pratense TaxID=57577 RepID=A0ACB0JFX7_TRIPR|nr:unnamed protein product [Trifolium pratense]